jgi:hypothetical protein
MDVAKALYYLDDTTRRALLQGYGDMNREHWRQALSPEFRAQTLVLDGPDRKRATARQAGFGPGALQRSVAAAQDRSVRLLYVGGESR